jgi:DNA repair protein RecO
MLKNDEILIIGKIGPKISVALSKNNGKIKFIGSQSLLTLSVYKVNFYFNDTNDLVKIKESKFLYSFYPLVKNYQKYKAVSNVFRIINEIFPSFFESKKIYEITLNYLNALLNEEESIEKLYVLWIYNILWILDEINHILFCRGCGSASIKIYKINEGSFCFSCKKNGDFEFEPFELELIKSMFKLNFDNIKKIDFDVKKFITIFEDVISAL